MLSRRCALLALPLLVLAAPLARGAGPGEGADIEIGGPGGGQGKFSKLADITFGPDDHLYVLDGAERRDDAWVGNLLVQEFDNSGKFLRQFSLRDDQLAGKNAPARIAVDSRGHVYVTFPDAGRVREYAPDGELVHDYEVRRACAIAVRTVGGKEEVLVAARHLKREEPIAEFDRFQCSDAELGPPLKLSHPIADCADLAADRQGNLYAQAATNQVYKFGPDGKRLTAIGGGTNLRLEDGSELIHTVAVDAAGHIYSITWGNPGIVTRFDPGVTTVTQHRGEFYWFDPWGTHSGYTPFAVDGKNRLWIGSVGNNDGKDRYHFRPCVLRTKENFLDPDTNQATVTSALTLGLNLAVETPLPYHVAYALAPVSADLVVKAGVRRLHQAVVTWNVYDTWKNPVAGGRFDLPLEDGKEARHTVTFTPPRWGWYMLQFQLAQAEAAPGGKPARLAGLAAFFGATPKYDGLPVLAEGDSPGGWEDAPRQAFAGLPNMRVHPKPGNFDTIDKRIDECAKYGVTLLAQFEGKDQCTPDFVKEALTHFKGRIRFWEIWNEPNFAIKPEDYVALLKELRAIIKAIDPQARVLAPAVCGIQLPWYEAFYKAGGKDFCDILSIHDYEGHESIDPVHWFWKYAALKKLMTAHGDADKPVWQTERAVTGVRGASYLGPSQAVRVTLQRDLAASLGVSNEHNFHYYLNDGGFAGCPSWLWSRAGPNPGALATRTRAAMIRGRRFVRTLDFGPTGSKVLFGPLFEGDDGSTLILRNFGAPDLPVDLRVTGKVECFDAFGNPEPLAPKGGLLRVTASALPRYLRLAKGARAEAVPIDFGANIAPEAALKYSADSKGDLALLTNGVLEVFHAGHPQGGTDGKTLWTAALPSHPQTLEITFPRPRTVDKVLLFGTRPDNQFSAILSYDLEYHDGKSWAALARVRAHCPDSDLVDTPLCRAASWYLDPNCFVNTFKPVTADRFRLVVHRATLGFLAGEIDRAALGNKWDSHFMLREIEIYAPSAPGGRK